MVRCGSTGAGVYGAVAANMSYEKCLETYGSIGYIDIDSAGVTGIRRLTSDKGAVRVAAIAPNSPASAAGILLGDQILSIGNQPVSESSVAVDLLFGRIGKEVSLKTRRGTAEQTVNLTLVPYKSLYGAEAVK